MSIDNNIFELMSTSNTKMGWDTESMDFVLNLEVLNQCAHHCPGCFVNRRNAIDDIDIKAALQLAKSMNDKGMRFREVVLSPTDIFSAINTVTLLTNPDFQELLNIHPKTRITTTAMFENLNWDNWHAVFEVLDNPDYFREEMILELIVPIDVEKILSRDKYYYDQFHKAIDFLKNDTPKEIDWSFAINIHHNQDLEDQFDEVSKIAHEEFHTIIEYLPSFFRTGNTSKIEEHLGIWKNFLRSAINEENFKDVTLTIADPDHNAMNTMVVNYRKGSLHLSPFIYEQILTEDPIFKIDGFTADDVIEKHQELLAKQFEYIPKTSECGDCKHLMACVGRDTLAFMESENLVDCIYPKEIIDMYHSSDIDARGNRIKRCADNIK